MLDEHRKGLHKLTLAILQHSITHSTHSGKSPDKPWLIRLRREFLRRDPSHNSLGDGPLYVSGGDFYDDEEEEQTALNNLQSDNHTPYTGEGTPAVDQSAALAVQPPPADTITVQASEDNADVKLKTEENDQTTAMDITESSDAVKDVKEEEEKPAWLAEFPNSKGWEDLSLHEQVGDSLIPNRYFAFTDLRLALYRYMLYGQSRNGTSPMPINSGTSSSNIALSLNSPFGYVPPVL